MRICLPSPRKVAVLVSALALCGFAAAAPALAHSSHHHHHRHHHHHGHASSSFDPDSGDSDSNDGGDTTGDAGGIDDQPVTGTDAPDAMVPAAPPAVTGPEKLETFKITGFGARDNTPPGSTTISMPCIHKQAGGTGTFTDPLTAATPGHAGSTENPKCTKFYVPGIHRFVIIEDSGASKFSQPHLDIWSGTTANVEDCEGKITTTEQIIRNPSPNHPVTAGPLATGSGCNI